MQIDKKTVRNLFLAALSCIVLYWVLVDTARVKVFLGMAWKVVQPFTLGAIIAFVFNVPMRAVERQLKWIRADGLRRTAAILLTLVLLVLILAFVVELLLPQIEITVNAIMERLPDFIKRTATGIRAFLAENPQIEEWILEYTQLENINWTNVLEKIMAFVGSSLSTIADGAFSAIGSLTNGIFNAFVSVAFSIYALARKEILARQGRRIVYSLIPENAADETIRILRLTNTTFSNFISGQCLEACILGGLFAVTMVLFGMPYIPLVSVIIAITALIPLVGAFIGCILGAFFILVESPIQALAFVVMFLVIQQIEGNLIYPRVVGTSIGLPGMWVLAAVSIGGELMGVGGMLVMIPLASVAYTLLGEFTQRRVRERNIDPAKLKDQPPMLKSKFKEKREKKREQKLLMKMKELAEKSTEHIMHKKPDPAKPQPGEPKDYDTTD